MKIIRLLLCFFIFTYFKAVIGGGTNEKTYTIEISISGCKLMLYEIVPPDGSRKVIREYKVATAKKGLSPVPLGKGTVTKIEFNPWWYPTAYSQEYFKQKGIDLARAVPPGDPLNFLGTVSIHLSHITEKGATYRIHGNNDESLIGKRVTGGCIRIYNKDIGELSEVIGEGTEVEILP